MSAVVKEPEVAVEAKPLATGLSSSLTGGIVWP